MSKDDKNVDNRIVNEEDLILTSLEEDDDYYYEEVEIITHEVGKPALSIVENEDPEAIKPVEGYKKPMDFDVDAELAAMEAYEKSFSTKSYVAEDTEDALEAQEDENSELEAKENESDSADEEPEADDSSDDNLEPDEESEDELEDSEEEDSEEDVDSDDDLAENGGNIITFPGGEENEEPSPRRRAKEAGSGVVAKLVVALIIIALFAGAAIAGITYRKNHKKQLEEDTKKAESDYGSGDITEAPIATGPDANIPTRAPEEKYDWWYNRDVSAAEDRVFIGKWPQGPDGQEEPIAWKVVAEVGDKKLIISEYVIDLFAFSTEGVVQWENSGLRAYLNGEFYETAFSNRETKKLKSATLENDDNIIYNVAGGKETTDKLFVLSYKDIENYFDGVDLKAKATPYILENGAAESEEHFTGYWLRTPGQAESVDGKPGYASMVSLEGMADYFGQDTKKVFGVRLAAFINK